MKRQARHWLMELKYDPDEFAFPFEALLGLV
jgi:hypothetical protein